MVQYLWVSPLHLIVFTYLVYQEVAWSAFLATGFVILQLPLQMLMAKAFSFFRFVVYFTVIVTSGYAIGYKQEVVLKL